MKKTSSKHLSLDCRCFSWQLILSFCIHIFITLMPCFLSHPNMVTVFSLDLKTAIWHLLNFVFDIEHKLESKEKAHKPPKTGRIWANWACFLSKVQKKRSDTIVSNLYVFNGAEKGIWTPAPCYRSARFPSVSLQPLGYLCIGASGGNRTRTNSLGSWSSTIKLRLQNSP